MSSDSIRQFLAEQQRHEKLLAHDDLYTSMVSKLAQNPLSEAEHIAREIEANSGWRQHAVDSVRNTLDTQLHAMRDAAGPLMRLRAETIYETELARAASLNSNSYASSVADSVAQHHTDSLAKIARDTTLTGDVAAQIHAAMGEQTRNRLADLAKPFASIGDYIQRQHLSVSEMFDAGEWARSLGIPTIDAASIVTVARVWGGEGTLRSLREMGGIDRETLRLMAAALQVDDTSNDEDSVGEDHADTHLRQQSRGLSLGDVVGILSILLALFFFEAQSRDSEEMEARLRTDHHALAAQMQRNEERMNQRIEHWAQLAEAVISHAQPMRSVQFVADLGGAEIRRSKDDEFAVTEALPGQAVTVIAEEGKWIQISYFDFVTRKVRVGWALKECFIGADGNSKPQTEAQE